MWIWPFRRVGSVVFVFCIKFRSNICYSHWDRRTCFRHSFDYVTRTNFRFRLLVMWSSPRRPAASSYIIWCKISLSSPKLLTLFRNSRWRPPPSWIFILCEFGHFDVLIVWCLCSVPNLVQISYSHWDRRTYASDLLLMASRELTSGFNFWSRGHLCVAVVHLPVKFGADIFIQSGVIDIFPKLKMVAAAILDCLGEPWDHPRSLSFVVRTSCKNFVMIG